jgi:acid phosphatase (class A)
MTLEKREGLMMIHRRLAAVSAMVLALSAVPAGMGGWTGGPAGAEARDMPPQRPPGFLGADKVPDFRAFLPGPPEAESALGETDAEVFDAMRRLEGSARWRMAQEDADLTYAAELGRFSCALGATYDAASTPALARLLARSMSDLGAMIGAAKDAYKRPRPFLEHEGALCLKPSDALAKSGSYPSGHAAAGWTYALILAEIAPDRAAPILARGRAIGESRVVCGVHYVTDIEDGRMLATALVTALNGNAGFRGAVAEARQELEALKADGAKAPDATICQADQEMLHRPW